MSEKIWTRLGREFGSEAGKKATIVRALHGLKSAGASFRNHLADYMRELGYESCKADADVWLKPETRPSDGFKYYSMCFVTLMTFSRCTMMPCNRYEQSTTGFL